MPGRLASVVKGWQERAAVRAEMELEPTRRRRFDRLPGRWADARRTRAERRQRRHGPAEINEAIRKTDRHHR